ncbi:MAG: DUF177 domain-containing protein [Clostridia bacterium]|nr:DUF177 domain-containing protein [Clostridia bacterium]
MTPILTGEKNRLDFDFEISLESDILPNVVFPKPVRVSGSVVGNGGVMQLFCRADIDYETVCARCLAKICGVLSVDYEKNVAKENVLQNEDNDDYVILEEGMLDFDETLIEQILLEFPSKLLCSEECKGLCPKCGKDLNEGDCGCPKREIDPRLAILARHRDEFKKD